MRRFVVFPAVICTALYLLFLPSGVDPIWLAGKMAGLFGLVVLLRAYAPTALEWFDAQVKDLFVD